MSNVAFIHSTTCGHMFSIGFNFLLQNDLVLKRLSFLKNINYNCYMSKLSVIIPIYNMEEYLSQCIESVLAQSFRDFELILINDGSTDNSLMICDSYKTIDPRIKIINVSNGGVSAARNVGIKHSSGTYITFIDPDDFLDDESIFEKCISFLDAGFDCVRYNFKTFGGKSEQTLLPICEDGYRFGNSDEKLRFLENYFFKYKVGHEVCNAFFRLSQIISNQLFFPEGINFGEDLFFSTLYSLFSKSLYYNGNCFYRYRIRKGSMMRESTNIVKLNEMNELSKRVVTFLQDKDFSCELITTIHFRFLNNQLKNISNFLLPTNFVKILKTKRSIEDKNHFYAYNKKYFDYFLRTSQRNYSFYKYKILYSYLSTGKAFAFFAKTIFFAIFVFPAHLLISLFE